jgi:hypothetical protein
MGALIFFVWIGCVILSTHIGIKRGFPILGFINGLVLGPLGLLIVAIQDDRIRKPCPECAEMVKKAAKVCPHCKQNLNT